MKYLLSVVMLWCAVATWAIGTETVFTQTTRHEEVGAAARFSREQWGLDETEWQRYQTLMQGIRGSISPATLSPVEVLGIHARDEAERKKYAIQFARLMLADTERVLAFQRAYDDAWKELNPSGQMIGEVAGLPSTEPALRAGDRVLVFVRLENCSDCLTYLRAARRAAETVPDVQVDFYVTGARDDAAIGAWAAGQKFDLAKVKSKKITFNHERGELTRLFGVSASLPKLVRLRGQDALALDPFILLSDADRAASKP